MTTPKGPFGFSRLTSLGPFVSDGYLYHSTWERNIDSILQNGLEAGYESALENADAYESGKMTSISVIDSAIDSFKPRGVDVPDRRGSNFFFTSVEQLKEVLENDWRDYIIKVDPSRIPCDGGVGSWSRIKPVFNGVIPPDLMGDGDHMIANAPENVPENLQRDIIDYWKSTGIYADQRDDDIEVWFPCDIPPSSIEAVLEV